MQNKHKQQTCKTGDTGLQFSPIKLPKTVFDVILGFLFKLCCVCAHWTSSCLVMDYMLTYVKCVHMWSFSLVCKWKIDGLSKMIYITRAWIWHSCIYGIRNATRVILYLTLTPCSSAKWEGVTMVIRVFLCKLQEHLWQQYPSADTVTQSPFAQL